MQKAIHLCVYQCNDQAFGRTGVLALASMLAKLPSLTDISMAHNHMQDGQESLADAIGLSKLEVVNLEACELSTGFVKELRGGRCLARVCCSRQKSHRQQSFSLIHFQKYFISPLKIVQNSYQYRFAIGMLCLTERRTRPSIPMTNVRKPEHMRTYLPDK